MLRATVDDAAAPRVLAVDWSGDARAPDRRIRVGEARPGRLIDVRGGMGREAVVEHVLGVAQSGPVVVGLDFSFALPAWFARRHGCRGVAALWELVADEGEAWLRDCRPPFWGRPGTRRPPPDPRRPRWRRTERAAFDRGLRPGSTFQIGGAGAVGTGSLRGMPLLARLRAAGVAVWPFDPAGHATAVEIYPRELTGPVVKASAAARRERVAADLRIPDRLAPAAAATEDGFDAALSAVAMAERVHALARLEARPEDALEGAIWTPADRTTGSCSRKVPYWSTGSRPRSRPRGR